MLVRQRLIIVEPASRNHQNVSAEASAGPARLDPNGLWERGDAAATQMSALHPVVKRLQPSAHDWNDALVSSQ